MPTNKVSVSLSADDIAYLDTQTLSGRYASRSAVLHDAIRRLREAELADAYAEAFGAWDEPEWDAASADGITA